MNVTDEMIEKGATAAFQQIENGAYVRAHLRTAFAAALADVPEPGAIVKACDMACRGLEERIAELEAQLDKVRAWHQQAHCECFSGDGLDALDAILKEGP